MRLGRARDRRRRGPRLGTKLALLVLALAMVLVPWLSTLLLDEMGQALAQMQSQHQRLTAKSISTVFHGREDLFADLPVEPSEYEALFAEPIANLVRLDGAASDWGSVAQRARWFGPAGDDASFALSLGTRGSMLYAHLDVVDDARVFRDPAFLRLDNADQVRISFIQANGEDGRIAVTLSESGATTAYRMDADWSFAAAGPPESDVEGFATATDTGYALELRLPFALLGARRFFGLAVVDVDDAETRAIRTVTHTLPAESAADSFQLVPLRSPDLLSILEGLGYSGMHILVIDAERRIRAETGSPRAAASARPPRSWETRLLDWLTALRGLPPGVADDAGPQPIDRVMDAALSGEGLAVRRSAGGGRNDPRRAPDRVPWNERAARHPAVGGADPAVGRWTAAARRGDRHGRGRTEHRRHTVPAARSDRPSGAGLGVELPRGAALSDRLRRPADVAHPRPQARDRGRHRRIRPPARQRRGKRHDRSRRSRRSGAQRVQYAGAPRPAQRLPATHAAHAAPRDQQSAEHPEYLPRTLGPGVRPACATASTWRAPSAACCGSAPSCRTLPMPPIWRIRWGRRNSRYTTSRPSCGAT